MIYIFISFVVASITGIILSSVMTVNGQTPDWINHVTFSIMAAGVISSFINKSNLNKLCCGVNRLIPKICKQHCSGI